MPREMSVGDMVLLYCTATYAEHAKTAPGIGIVTTVNHASGSYEYEYLPFRDPAPLDFLRLGFADEDRPKLLGMRHSWLFEISPESFRLVTKAAKLSRVTRKQD
jgi:hypothetical protein